MIRFLTFFLLLVLLGVSPLASSEDKKSAKVTGTFIIPKTVPDIQGQTVEILLFKYDTRLAGKAADLVEKIEIKDFKHESGKETSQEFTIGAKADLEEGMGYYMTLFVLKDGNRTHMGEAEHAPKNLCKVLTMGNPNKIKMTVLPVR
ncbi:MAG: hypothetical protein N2112_02670 [Gemmataceae bacterium]|jgi:hypothetical protein|nr:hypothetical protein [Gemmataceae bacterium]